MWSLGNNGWDWAWGRLLGYWQHSMSWSGCWFHECIHLVQIMVLSTYDLCIFLSVYFQLIKRRRRHCVWWAYLGKGQLKPWQAAIFITWAEEKTSSGGVRGDKDLWSTSHLFWLSAREPRTELSFIYSFANSTNVFGPWPCAKHSAKLWGCNRE